MKQLNVLSEGGKAVVWVVGGAGFIGSHICDALIDLGARVVCIDDWQFGIDHNISHLINHPHFRLIKHESIKPLPVLPHPHYIFHTAYVDRSVGETHLSSFWANLISTQQLLHIAMRSRARFLLVSTQRAVWTQLPQENLGDFAGPDLAGVEGKRLAEALTGDFVTSKRVDARVVRLADVYGPRMSLISEPFGEVFKNALYKNTTSGNGEMVWPLFVDDATRGIISAMFAAGTKNRIFSFDVQPRSLGDFARAVEEVVSENQSIFHPLGEEGGGLGFQTDSAGVIPSTTSMENGIRKTLAFFEIYKTKLLPLPKIPPGRRRYRWSGRLGNKVSRVLVVGLVAAVIIFLVPLFSFLLGGGFVMLAKQQVAAGNFARAEQLFNSAYTFYTFDLSLLGMANQLPVVGPSVSSLHNSSYTAVLGSRVGARAARIARVGQAIVGQALSQERGGGGKEQNTISLSAELEALAGEMGLLLANTTDEQQLSSFLNMPEAGHLVASLFPLAQLAKELPDLLGENGVKTYLVLFQNNMELRPTGGFIGSFGLFTFDRGRLADSEIYDVYEADGQLVGHVEPPIELKEHLGEANWYFRDSNWSPDFPITAQRAEWFLDKEMGKKVDGVVAVDLELVRQLIAVLGKVEVREFNEVITADNFYVKTQARAEHNFFPGSTQKADFLTALNKSLIRQLTDQTPRDEIAFGRVLFTSLTTRHALIYLHNSPAQTAIARLGWQGALRTVVCPSDTCQKDYLALFDANVGVNKANYKLKRSAMLDVFITKEKIVHELTVNYANNDVGDVYKNYLRLYIPQEAELSQSTALTKGGQQPVGLAPTTGIELGRKVIGMLVEVPRQTTGQLRLAWSLPTDLSFTPAKNGRLAFLWQKQPGTLEDPIVVRFHYPQDSKLVITPTPSLTKGGIVGYTTTLSQDLEVTGIWKNKR